MATNIPLCSFHRKTKKVNMILFKIQWIPKIDQSFCIYLPIHKHRIKRRKIDLSHHENKFVYIMNRQAKIFLHVAIRKVEFVFNLHFCSFFLFILNISCIILHIVKLFHIKIRKLSFCHNCSIKVKNPPPNPKKKNMSY